MDIQGIGESMIDILVDQKILQNIADIFTLGDPQIQMTLQRLPGFGNKKVSEIAIQLLQAKEKPLRRLLNGLGIGHVGKKTAIILNDNLINYYSLQDETLSPLENLIKHITDETFLQAIFGIGEKTLQEIQEFFTKKNNKELLERLSVFGINFDPIKWYKDKENLGIFEELNQGSFCITGSFPVSRENIVETMQTHGRTFHEQPKKDTQLMLIGDKPGSKKAKAEELGCEIIQSRETILLRFPFLQDITPEETKKISTNMPISQSLF
jgi:DNA ligase (NAD+)